MNKIIVAAFAFSVTFPTVLFAQTAGSGSSSMAPNAPAASAGQPLATPTENDNTSSPKKPAADKIRSAVPGNVGSGVQQKPTATTPTVAPQ
jgi:hypothetical protein